MAAQVYGERWQIQHQLRGGGQAHTFLVKDTSGQIPEPCVLKRLRKVKRKCLERFRQEVEAVQSIEHPHVIKLIDYDLESKQPYLVMEYCRNGNLEQNKQRWSGDPLRALELFSQVCDGLAAAHEAGIVHRDIKPENILLRGPDGPAVVADFGICYLEGGKRQTLTDEPVGAFRFRPPEVEDGRVDEVSAKQDVYSLGKLLYWFLSEGIKFSGEKHREPEWNLVERLGDRRLEHVNRLLDRMIAADPSRRLEDATEVAEKARTLSGVIKGRYNAASGRVPQPCMYCGQGTYSVLVEGWAVEGLHVNPARNWQTLVCGQCGHVQLFCLDSGSIRREWWQR